MRILITGATGFVGLPVLLKLREQGHELHAVVRPESPRKKTLQTHAKETITHEASLYDGARLSAIVAETRPELAIHLAWPIQPGYLSSTLNLSAMQGSLAMAQALAEHRCGRLMVVGSCFEYDTHQGYLREDTPLSPPTLYGESKASLFRVLSRALESTDTRLVWPRLFYLYGPHESKGRLVPSVIRSLLEGSPSRCSPGDQIRDFLHVNDAADALCRVAQSDLTGPVNVASGVPITVKTLVKTIAKACGNEHLVEFGALPYRADESMFVCADTHRLSQALGFTPAFDLSRGVGHVVAWWKEELAKEKPSS